MIYFISGHRDLSYEDFELYYKPVIDNVITNDKESIFIVGDYEGVDKFAMNYIFKCYAVPLIIYHMFNNLRNIPEGLSENPESERVFLKGGFKSDEERDSAMTKASDFDIAFVKDNRWNSGTAQNIKRRHGI